MPFEIIRNDITKLKVDAIVNAAKNSLLGGGGVDGAIHRAAGPGLLRECRTLGGCNTGEAKITGAYSLPCKYVIHTVGPVWHGGNHGEKELLEACYRNSLKLAKENNCETVAFPLISSGAYGYPKDRALKIAVDVISDFLLENDMLVYLVIFDKAAFMTGSKLFSDIKQYIDDNYICEHTDSVYNETRRKSFSRKLYSNQNKSRISGESLDECAELSVQRMQMQPLAAAAPNPGLADMLDQIDESFSEMLLRKIDEKGMSDAECYKKANIDRKLFSKIRSDTHYKPSKPTAIAFAVALELTLDETKDMLMKAGFALSHSNKFDIIIEYFILNGNYDIYEINEALFAFDQTLLGAR